MMHIAAMMVMVVTDTAEKIRFSCKNSQRNSQLKTQTLFAYGGTVSTDSDQKLYHPPFLCLLFSIIYYIEESWTLDLPDLPAMLNSLNAE